jgi:hypothetical protein
MKKIIISFTILVLGLNVIAQDSVLVNKHGRIILPQKGDIAIGLSADPFLYYVGNMFNGNTNNSLNLGDQNLYFRYFLSDNQAIRVTIRVNSSKNTYNYYVTDDAARAIDPLSRQQVEDRQTSFDNNYGIRIGYQKFRGYNRLRGFYGADLGFAYYKTNYTREYGNQMNQLNPSPTTHWGNLSSRTLESNDGATESLSLGIFGGAEYYIMPKICIGAELGIQYGKMWESQGNLKGEEMNLTQLVKYDRAVTPGDRSSNLYTTFPYSYGSLYLMVHF